MHVPSISGVYISKVYGRRAHSHIHARTRQVQSISFAHKPGAATLSIRPADSRWPGYWKPCTQAPKNIGSAHRDRAARRLYRTTAFGRPLRIAYTPVQWPSWHL